MILKIPEELYYGEKNKTKKLFMLEYKKLGLQWLEGVRIGEDLVSGWFSIDRKKYLLKLPEEGKIKRFSGNCEEMFTFLKGIGAVETEVKDTLVFTVNNRYDRCRSQIERFGRFVGADLYSHYRAEELLKEMPDNWGVIWS